MVAVAPLDTIKTKVQLRASGAESETAAQLAVRLLRRDGLLSLYSGFTPRRPPP